MYELAADSALRAKYPGSVCALCSKAIAAGEMIAKLMETSQWAHLRCIARRPDPGDEDGSWHDE